MSRSTIATASRTRRPAAAVLLTLVVLGLAGLVGATPAWAAGSLTDVTVSFVKGGGSALPGKNYEPVLVSQAEAGKTTGYVISFTSPEAVPSGGSITVVAPPGTFLPGTWQGLLYPTSSLLLGRVFYLRTEASADGSTLTTVLGGNGPSILAGDSDNLVVQGRTPTTPGQYTMSVTTSVSDTAVTSAPYTIVPKGSPESHTAKWACIRGAAMHGWGRCVSELAPIGRASRPPKK